MKHTGNGVQEVVVPPTNGGRRGVREVVLPRRTSGDSTLWAKIKTLEDAQHDQAQRISDLEHRVKALEHPSIEGYAVTPQSELPRHLLSQEFFVLEGPDSRSLVAKFRQSLAISLIRGRAGAVCYSLSRNGSSALVVALKSWKELVPDAAQCHEYQVELPSGHLAIGFGLKDCGVKNFLFPRGLGEDNVFFKPLLDELTKRGNLYPPLMLSGTDPGELVSWIGDDNADSSERGFRPVKFHNRELPGVIFPVASRQAGLYVADGNMVRKILVPPTYFNGRDRSWEEVAEWRCRLMPWFSRPVKGRYVIMVERDSGLHVLLDLRNGSLNYLMASKKPVVFPAGWRFVGIFNQNRTSAFLKQSGQILTLILEPSDRVESCVKRTTRMIGD